MLVWPWYRAGGKDSRLYHPSLAITPGHTLFRPTVQAVKSYQPQVSSLRCRLWLMADSDLYHSTWDLFT